MTASLLWLEDAACVGAPLDKFFDVPRTQAYLTVQQYCADCPVRLDCLQWAKENPGTSRYGIWGGRIGSSLTSNAPLPEKQEPVPVQVVEKQCPWCGHLLENASVSQKYHLKCRKDAQRYRQWSETRDRRAKKRCKQCNELIGMDRPIRAQYCATCVNQKRTVPAA